MTLHRSTILVPGVGAILALVLAYGASPPPVAEEPGVLLSPLDEAPVRAAHEALRRAEERHQRRFAEAADPAKAEAELRERLATAVAAKDGAALAALGRELFLRDLPHPASRAQAIESTRCASCHHKFGPGGAGGLVDNFFENRNPPALGGAALLERAAAEMTAELKAQAAAGSPLRAKGVSFGSPGRPEGIGADLVVRPFGRGRWAAIPEAVDAMASRALGVTLSAPEREALVAFVRDLPAPALLPPDPARLPDLHEAYLAGRKRFREVGCDRCHLPELPLADGTAVRAFTDLKEHDLGPDLAQGDRRRWLTAPLWGLASTTPWLHDGRALASLDEAIVLHGGEAEESRRRYERLPDHARAELRTFLLSSAQRPRLFIAGE